MVSEGGADTTGELQPKPEAFSLRDLPRVEDRDEDSDREEGEEDHQNCSFSVEPTSALVLERPPEITSETTSK